MTLHIPEIQPSFTTTPVPNSAVESTPYKRSLKRILDVTLTIASIPLVLPLIAIAAMFVLIDGGKPFYSQLRVGQGGRHFRIWKLRTMVVDAEKRLASYLKDNPAARAEWDENQKLKNDPRITLLGRLLRKTSLDELPQLWNVLNGTMSLVGPRPMMVDQEAYYPGKAYYRMRPGITGLWQISDRNNCNFVGRVAYDEEYYKSLSLKMDAQIILKTFSVVMRATGH